MWKRSIHIVICSLLLGVYRVADKSKLEWKLSLTPFSPQDARNHILGLWNFKIFWCTTPHQTPIKKGTKGPLLIQLVYLFNPAGYVKFYWNPWDDLHTEQNLPHKDCLLGYLYFIVDLVHANQSKQKTWNSDLCLIISHHCLIIPDDNFLYSPWISKIRQMKWWPTTQRWTDTLTVTKTST